MPSLNQFRSSNATERSAERILVVNDNDELTENLRVLLEHSGYQSFAASDTESALEIVRAQKVDLIIQDIKRPGKDGWTFHRLLKSDPFLRNIPIVILSAASKQSQEYMAPQSMRSRLICRHHVILTKY